MDKVKRHMSGGVGHLHLLAGFGIFAAWYGFDAFAAQSKVQNMLLIAPAATVVVILVVLILLKEIRSIARGTDAVVSDEPPGETFQQRHGTLCASIGMVVYVIAMPFIGFDVATVVFIAVSMVLQGARNWIAILFFSLFVGLLPVWSLENVLSVPVPTFFL